MTHETRPPAPLRLHKETLRALRRKTGLKAGPVETGAAMCPAQP